MTHCESAVASNLDPHFYFPLPDPRLQIKLAGCLIERSFILSKDKELGMEIASGDRCKQSPAISKSRCHSCLNHQIVKERVLDRKRLLDPTGHMLPAPEMLLAGFRQ